MYDSVNTDGKAVEEQNENLKKPKTAYKAQNKTRFDPKNYLDVKLGKDETSKTVKVRFLPISSTDGTVFFDIITHSLKVDKEVAKSGFKSYVCLDCEKTGSTEKCPICNKSHELYEKAKQAAAEGKQALSKSLYKEAGSIMKKRTFITRVIDRDHEDEGVKFWRFNENSMGEGIYDKLMSLFITRRNEAQEEGEDNYSIFDLYNGKDIIINITKSFIPDGHGGMKESLAYNITDGGIRKPLSKDIDKANEWLNDPKTWKDVYSLKTADYLKIVVDGKIPVYDREKHMFVEKEIAVKDAEKNEADAADEILNEGYSENGTPSVPDTPVEGSAHIDVHSHTSVNNLRQNNEDDLPF